MINDCAALGEYEMGGETKILRKLTPFVQNKSYMT
jgi:hypothetical protein